MTVRSAAVAIREPSGLSAASMSLLHRRMQQCRAACNMRHDAAEAASRSLHRADATALLYCAW